MLPVVSVVGRSDSGKTTLLEKVIAELKRRGYRVATIKHDVHGFDLDHPGKDTWRHAQAGADLVVISSPAKLAMIEKLSEERSLDQVIAGINGVDLVLTEGYKAGNKPKIEVVRSGFGAPLCQPDELVAVAGDLPVHIQGVPWYHWNDGQGIVDLLVARFLS